MRPFVGNFRDGKLAAQPLLGEVELLLPAFELVPLGPGDDGVGGNEPVAAVFPVARAAVVVERVARRRVARLDQRHVALAALDRLVRVTLLVPVTGSPVVVLVLQLDPADPIDLRVNELLVAGGTILRLLERALGQLVVLRRIAANEKIPRPSPDAIRGPLPKILARLGDRVIRVALDVGFADGLAGQTRDTLHWTPA
jgi:hypothetical protein